MKRAVLMTVFFAMAMVSSYAQEFRYTVKFVCGSATQELSAKPVAQGIYFTAINVHNTISKDIGLTKHFSVALPGEKAGQVSKLFKTSLGADQSMEIDCADILNHLNTKGFVKGFAVIVSAAPLDVIAVYTTSAGSGINTFFLERVPQTR